ncbi:MAG: hypothetical protein PHR35_15945 [Kiritimatiellae bacterium]|nr:hypothetical protein [Kiritimatiellia bacterium]
MKMKRAVVLAAVVLAGYVGMAGEGTPVDPVVAELDRACGVYQSAEGMAALRAWIVANPGGGESNLCKAHFYLGAGLRCLGSNEQFTVFEKVVAFKGSDYLRSIAYGWLDRPEKVLEDCPDAGVEQFAGARMALGTKAMWAGKYGQAESEFKKGLEDYPECSAGMRRDLQVTLAGVLGMQGKRTEGTRLLVTAIVNNVRAMGAPNEESPIWRWFEDIDPALLSAAEYREFLENVIRATKATEENARFLGRVKSELVKMKE